MTRISLALATAAGIVAAGAPTPTAAQKPRPQLGKVEFQTSCTKKAQRTFNQAMLYQHSFWYRSSRRTFEAALDADRRCAIAYWGIALSLLENPHTTPPAANLAEGFAMIEKGRAAKAKTQRERDYIEALAAFYTDHQTVDHSTRVQRYVKAMEDLAQRYPKDDEAQISYAIALNVAASPTDKTYANQLKGAALLEPIFKRRPQHPGVAHYLIHLYDYPAIAGKGLEAARRYAKVAPAAPHAQHMPSHIFTRVGYWQDSIASNAKSAEVAKRDNEADDQLHAMDYLVYAHLQLAQDKRAAAIVEDMSRVQDFRRLAGFFGLAASPARYMVERGDWKGAANLPSRTSRFAATDAITHFARALGAARSGDPAAAKPDIAKLEDLAEKLRKDRDGYWSSQVDIQRQVATAWVLYAEGQHDQALRSMSAAADAEDKTEKHPVTPGPLAPARELYGVMLLDRGLPRDALSAFETTLKKEPNRLAAYIGAAKAAHQAGDSQKAKEYAAKVAELTKNADVDRPEIQEVRAFATASGPPVR